MLQKLHIQNYAIIEELVISFSKNLNIITGETGAGKSILMGALNLILGQRADTAVLLDKGKKCIVEGSFSTKANDQIKAFFAEQELDADDEVLLRREIAPNGKSRSFVNDTPVNLSQLKQLALLLVDLHQQFDTLELKSEDFQREVIDAFANNAGLIKKLKTKFGEYAASKKALEALKLQQAEANRELDYNRFLYDELEQLSLKENELEELDNELRLLSNAEQIKQQLEGIYFEMKDNEQAILPQLKALQNKLKTLQSFHTDIDQLHTRMSSSLIELQDIASELEAIDGTIHYDAERIQEINERISQGYKLLKKHNVQETGELLQIQKQLEEKLTAVLNISADIEKMQREVDRQHAEAIEIANKISSNRKGEIEPFAQQVNKLLARVGMPNAQLKVSVTATQLSETGTDEVLFLFDANKSKRFEPMHKVASGGELSRLMLSIKSLVAKKLELPTLIFDEIDTGISGEAAKQVGIIMQELSGEHQLISITHQPQIAAKATAHYFVHKKAVGEKIITSIRLLSPEERITTIAQMLGGEKPTKAALENAREMMVN